MDQAEFAHSAKLIAIYARVSTARQEEDGTIATQLTSLQDFARQNTAKRLLGSKSSSGFTGVG
jgi:site-specific DNA recombinase